MNDMTPQTLRAIPDSWRNRPADQRFANLNSLFDYTNQLADVSEATIHKADQIEVVVDESCSTPESLSSLELRLPDGRVTRPSHFTFGQLCSLTGCPPGFMRQLVAPIAAVPLQYKINTYKGELVKSYVRSDTMELRAITGQAYGRVEDFKLVDAVRQIAGNGIGDSSWRAAQVLNGGTPEFYASDRDMFVFLVDVERPIVVGKTRDGDDDMLYRGFFAWNSEVGSKSLGIKTFLFRTYCDNRLIFGADQVEDMVIRHTKNAPERFLEFAAPALAAYALSSDTGLVNGIQQAMQRVIARSDEDAVDFLRDRLDLSAKAAKAALQRHAIEEGKPVRSAWDMVQAATAIARDIPHQNERVDAERRAGRLLVAA